MAICDGTPMHKEPSGTSQVLGQSWLSDVRVRMHYSISSSRSERCSWSASPGLDFRCFRSRTAPGVEGLSYSCDGRHFLS